VTCFTLGYDVGVKKIIEIAEKHLQCRCVVENVPMDGNCMFSSIALQIERLESNASTEVREQLLEYMTSHPEMVSKTATYALTYSDAGIVYDDSNVTCTAKIYNRWPLTHVV